MAKRSTSRPVDSQARCCPRCQQPSLRDALRTFDSVVMHDGHELSIHVMDAPVAVCSNCGLTKTLPGYAEASLKAVREALNVLGPDEIAALRDDLGISQKKLAEATGVRVETLCRWEKGKAVPSRSANLRLLEAFNRIVSSKIEFVEAVASLTPSLRHASNSVVDFDPSECVEPSYAMAA